MTLHGILSLREIVAEEVRLVGLCSEPNVQNNATETALA